MLPQFGLVKTYDLLGNYGQGDFIRDKFIEYLGITGMKLQPNLTILTREKSEETMTINRLILSGLDLKNTRTNEWIGLQRACSKQSLPVEREEIATPNKTKK